MQPKDAGHGAEHTPSAEGSPVDAVEAATTLERLVTDHAILSAGWLYNGSLMKPARPAAFERDRIACPLDRLFRRDRIEVVGESDPRVGWAMTVLSKRLDGAWREFSALIEATAQRVCDRVAAIGKDGQRCALPVSEDPFMPLREEIDLRWQSTGVCGFCKPSGVQPLRLWLPVLRGRTLTGR